MQMIHVRKRHILLLSRATKFLQKGVSSYILFGLHLLLLDLIQPSIHPGSEVEGVTYGIKLRPMCGHCSPIQRIPRERPGCSNRSTLRSISEREKSQVQVMKAHKDMVHTFNAYCCHDDRTIDSNKHTYDMLILHYIGHITLSTRHGWHWMDGRSSRKHERHPGDKRTRDVLDHCQIHTQIGSLHRGVDLILT